jgi:hypothetical protein
MVAAVALVERLFFGELQQGLVLHLAAFDFVDPEFSALAGMASDGLAVLARDGDLHLQPSSRSF